MKHIFNKQKIILVVLISGLVVTVFSVGNAWQDCIDNLNCARNLVHHWLRPIYYASLSLLGFFSFFLLLPIRYFYWWLLLIFSWGFPASILLVNHSLGMFTGLFPLNPREVILILSQAFTVLTLLFVGIVYWLKRRKNTSNTSA